MTFFGVLVGVPRGAKSRSVLEKLEAAGMLENLDGPVAVRIPPISHNSCLASCPLSDVTAPSDPSSRIVASTIFQGSDPRKKASQPRAVICSSRHSREQRVPPAGDCIFHSVQI